KLGISQKLQNLSAKILEYMEKKIESKKKLDKKEAAEKRKKLRYLVS
ncbi:8327_t:CDS:1, partial [Racocetra persica]